MVDISNYDKLREDAHKFYGTIGSVAAPALGGERVHFSAEGFNHLIFKGARSEREKSSQILRFKLLPPCAKLQTRAIVEVCLWGVSPIRLIHKPKAGT